MGARRRECATLGPVPGFSGMRMRTLLTVLLAALCLTGGAASSGSKTEPATVRTPPTFFVTGHGWGHGLGMSQYGAYGYAQHGWTYDRIIKHYYTGVTIGQAPVARVRVLLAPRAKQVTLTSKSAFQIVDASGSKHALDAETYKIGAAFKVADPDKPGAKAKALEYPLEFRPGTAALSVNGRAYRGAVRILKLDKGAIRAVNFVGLDFYLRGVVPSEMPRDWASEALKAQAVAARSYAVSHLHPGGGFDLYPDTRDQVYLGIPHEAPATTAAVNATAGQVALYKGKVASTYFFSTSGGRTASVQDIYPEAEAIPYLVSVADPYDSISPYHDWGPYRFSTAALAKKLKAPGKVLDVKTVAAASGRVTSIIVTGAKGQATATGSDVRTALGLRSTWFQVGVLALGAPAAPVTYGKAAALAGTARGVRSVDLQQRDGKGAWKTVSTLKPRGGTIAPKIRPDQSSKFRLVVGDIASGAVAVSVAPSVTLRLAQTVNGFSGTVKPAAAGTTVTIQRQAGTAWRVVMRVKTTAPGSYVAAIDPTPGTYRARVVAKGMAPGLSKPVIVS